MGANKALSVQFFCRPRVRTLPRIGPFRLQRVNISASRSHFLTTSDSKNMSSSTPVRSLFPPIASKIYGCDRTALIPYVPLIAADAPIYSLYSL